MSSLLLAKTAISLAMTIRPSETAEKRTTAHENIGTCHDQRRSQEARGEGGTESVGRRFNGALPGTHCKNSN